MTVGFQAFTDTGLYQIDGQTPNLQCTQSMAAVSSQQAVNIGNTAQGPYYVTKWVSTFTFGGTTPIYAIATDGGVGATVWDHQLSSGIHTVRVITDSQVMVRFFVFDQVPPASSNFGLQVFDANGKLIADSSRAFFRVLDVVHDQYLSGTGWVVGGFPSYGPFSRSYGGRPVLIACPYGCHTWMDYSGGSDVGLTMFQVSGDTVSWYQHNWASPTPNWAGFRETFHCHFMVIDGTGLL
ncbi:hypothetical protein WK60_14100 [Burkholderia ubonensis]|nr:hypothetical protein WK60_14100 [Burkholderia ubonensis]KVZ57501.1 hypothetical protein WL19_03290 [Burkholderia ubonensis]